MELGRDSGIDPINALEIIGRYDGRLFFRARNRRGYRCGLPLSRLGIDLALDARLFLPGGSSDRRRRGRLYTADWLDGS
jgi:hypothetical protein